MLNYPLFFEGCVRILNVWDSLSYLFNMMSTHLFSAERAERLAQFTWLLPLKSPNTEPSLQSCARSCNRVWLESKELYSDIKTKPRSTTTESKEVLHFIDTLSGRISTRVALGVITAAVFPLVINVHVNLVTVYPKSRHEKVRPSRCSCSTLTQLYQAVSNCIIAQLLRC